MVKKKVDSRIRTLIENGLTTHHRSLFFLIGDHARDQIVNLHYILTKAAVKSKPTVLWAYKRDLGFTSHRQKRMRKLKKDIARGVRSVEDSESPFELFVGSTDIRYVYYRETDRILGNTYQMLVLQDFQALTPNLLARTIETVEGGGIVVVMLKTMTSLRQLYTLTMDVHARYRTEGNSGAVVGRFNERFLLSLARCDSSLVLDDELNVLPISSHVRDIQKAIAPTLTPSPSDPHSASAADTLSTRTFTSLNQKHLYELQLSMRDTQPIGALLDCCRTLDQAKAVLSFSEAISEKTLRSTVVLTAARGRGKSAALGLSVSAAVAYGYSNIFITAPSPENVKTLFDLVLRGFTALEYKEHIDFDVITSTAAEHNHAVVRVNVYHSHRQTVQYIAPSDAAALSQAELLVIDEAAAIPLPMVRALMGPYLVFMASTVNGYEGTGRSLALKLVKQLRQQAVNTQSSAAGETNGTASSSAVTSSASSSASATGGRTLREITLDEPIRYAPDDPIEAWLNDLLCLNCTQSVPRLTGGVPHPSQCELYYVERDTLFSSHRASESFLHRMMALYVSSHYKNSPNDLQLMSDAPGHHLFVLLPPQSSTSAALPDILAVVQVCLEGQISKASIAASLGRGERAAGDLIPWCVSQQFGSGEFGQLSGARVVRVAVHPEVQRMGYGKRAMQLLIEYYQGKHVAPLPFKHKPNSSSSAIVDDATAAASNGHSTLLTETVVPRKSLPPLLQSLIDVPPPSLHYIGVSFGLTADLFSFWSKLSFLPLYVRLTANALTGEHTCIMLRSLRESSGGVSVVGREGMEMRVGWLNEFVSDFRRRFVQLLSYQFTAFDSSLALSVLKEGEEAGTPPSAVSISSADNSPSSAVFDRWSSFRPLPVTFRDLCVLLTEFDLRRLESYADNLVDYHLVLDLLPLLASLLFTGRLPVALSFTQQAILLALGLQHKDVEVVGRELGLAVQQVLAQFNKSVRKLSTWMREEAERGKRAEVDKQRKGEKRKAPSSLPPTNGHKDEQVDGEEVNENEDEEDGEADEDGSAVQPGDEEEDAADEQHPRPLGLPLGRSMDAELESAALKVKEQLRDKQRALLSSADMQQYAIRGAEEKWDAELKGAAVTGGRVSIQTDPKAVEGKRRKVVHDNTTKRMSSGGRGAELGGVKKSSGKKRKVKQ